MKVMAVASQKVPLTFEQAKEHMKTELPATLKLYLEGKIEQFWFQEKVGPIFLMNVASLEDAKTTLSTLPLVAADIIGYDLKPVGPLIPLGLLVQPQ